MAECDARLAEIVGRHLNVHAIANTDPNEVLAHLAGDMGEHFVTIRQGNSKHGAGQHLCDRSDQFNRFFFWHVTDRIDFAFDATGSSEKSNLLRGARPGINSRLYNRCGRANDAFKDMKAPSIRAPEHKAFSLVELLVVMAIIGILAAILLPAVSQAPKRAKITTAKTEMRILATSIEKFFNEYGRYPVSKASEQAAITANADLTLGPAEALSSANNSELVIILEDIDQGPNAGHVRNPRSIPATLGRRVTGQEPGISTADWVFRDPWNNPYVITMDLNQNGKCLDAFYGRRVVSQQSDNQGFNGLVNTNGTGNSDHFEFSGTVMIWSFGPDGKGDPALEANKGVNADNVLSWR